MGMTHQVKPITIVLPICLPTYLVPSDLPNLDVAFLIMDFVGSQEFLIYQATELR